MSPPRTPARRSLAGQGGGGGVQFAVGQAGVGGFDRDGLGSGGGPGGDQVVQRHRRGRGGGGFVPGGEQFPLARRWPQEGVQGCGRVVAHGGHEGGE